MSEGSVSLRIDGAVARLVLSRPEAHNAMTGSMYRELKAACDDLAARPEIRVAVLRGAGGKAFVAGSDIALFADFQSAEDGVRYEADIGAYVQAVAALPFPTVAVIDGWAVGGGLAIASACDLRIAAPSARFGVPIARTVGNCLSLATHALLIDAFGTSRTKRMLLMGEMLDAGEARDCGFLSAVVTPEEMDATLDRMVSTLLSHAPITMRVSKEAIARIGRGEVEDEDLVRAAYGSADFKAGVAAFLSRKTAEWQGN